MINCLELISYENWIIAIFPWRHRLFLELSWELFVFFSSCLQFTVYSAAVCLTALQPFIKALLSIIWCSQLKLRKAFGVVWLILPPQSLCSPQQRCSQYFSPYALDQWSLDKSRKIIYVPRFLNDPLFTPGFPECCDFLLVSCQNRTPRFPHPLW